MNDLLHISPLIASILVVIIPFGAFLLQALLGKKAVSGNISLIAIILSTILSGIFVFAPIWQKETVEATYNWFTIGEKTFTIGILLNNLTVMMQFIVCIIALPVHIYSRSYMKGDPGIHRYWMYLSLFCFAMLGLTISKNLLMMYIFWELVGFASYLLIGFWYTRDAAVQANKKAFLVNRIGDLGFLIGIAILYTSFGTLDLVDLFSEQGIFAGQINKNTSLLTVAGISFFVGAMAKSAQFPLHIWLPDAMEGPTSVSSLIHAATMVAAGVFMLCSIFPLFNSHVLLIIAIIGTLTAVSASIFALAQYDIKKILAFSTISQLGFMMVAVGIGAWDAAMFHLATHAFFKCLLFLSAGAVIHEMSHLKEHENLTFDPQDLRNMGGLRRYMPLTFILMTIGSLALAGFPLTSGFLSKDAIVVAAWEWSISQGDVIYHIIPLLLIIVSILTAFYIGRLIFKAFFGEMRITEAKNHSFHDAPKLMSVPMLFLACCSLFVIYSWNPISYANAHIILGLNLDYDFPAVDKLHVLIPSILTFSAIIAWIIGYRWYVHGKYPMKEDSRLLQVSRHQFGLNSVLDTGIANAIVQIGVISHWFDIHIIDGIVNATGSITKSISRIVTWVDKHIVDGLVNATAQFTFTLGHILRHVQNGRLQNYLGFVFTLVLIGIIYLIIK